MATIISAGTTSGTALNVTPDTSGNLSFQTGAGANTIAVPNTTGTLALTSQLPVVGPTFSAYQNASAQTVSQNVSTKITFDATEWNVLSGYSTANSKFTPTTAGYYQVTASVGSQNVAGGVVQLDIFKNGSTYKSGFSINAAATYRSQMTCMVYMNGSTDYIEVYWYQNYIGTRATINDSTNTYFQGSLIRGA
jgi:hypothetical protein